MAKKTTTKSTNVPYREKPRRILLTMDDGRDFKQIRATLDKMLYRQMRVESAMIEGLKAVLKQWPKKEQPTVKAMLEKFVRSIE